ncbi:MAG: hypothetical protein ACP5HU_10565 [Phycisphaerae bacterium]
MESRETSLRVVTVARDGLLTADELARLAAEHMRCEQVESPYEAAAALLAAPAAAVAVDMPLLNRKHLRMLDLARKLGVVVLGTGAIPAGFSAEELRGVRLVGRAGLIDELLSLSIGRYVAAEPAQADDSPQEGNYEPQSAAGTYEQQNKRSVPLEPREQSGEADETPQAERSRQVPPAARQQRPQSTADVLSTDEIAALLEEDF